MHAFQDKMPLLVHLLNILDSLLRRGTPCKEYHTFRSYLGHGVDDFLREEFPPLARMRIGFVATDSKAGVDHENTVIRPGCQETALLRWLLEVRVILLERNVDVAKRRWGGCRRTHGEAKAVGLVRVVVGILACDDCLDSVEGRVPRPVPSISCCHIVHTPTVPSNGGLDR